MDDGQILFEVLTQVLFFAVLITAAVTDIKERKVYNWCTLPAVIFGLTLAWAVGGVDKLGGHFLYGVLPAVAIFGLLAFLGGMGPGDWKLMAAVGAIQGYPFVFAAIFWSMLAGCVMALAKLTWDGVLLKGLWRAGRTFISLKPPPEDEELLKQKIPYGVAISAGSIFSWFLIKIGGINL